MTRGVVPFENSTNGAVVFTLDLLADRQKDYANTTVCGEAYLSVHHCLLGHSTSESQDDLRAQDNVKTSAKNEDSLARSSRQSSLILRVQDFRDVKHIYSHPQAFGQCELFLSKYLKCVERHEVSSTSKAAEIVAQDSTGSSVAIASRIASKMHLLHVLAENIEDRDDNTTRFLDLGKIKPSVCRRVLRTTAPTNARLDKYKSLVSFTIDHNTPGALAEALMAFKTHGLNITSINSRPSRLQPWHYIFFVEFQGSRVIDPDGAVEAALSSLGEVAESWRWLGNWIDQTTCKASD